MLSGLPIILVANVSARVRGIEDSALKKLRLVLAIICAALVLFGVAYNVVALPFSSPLFDLISWVMIGAAFLILALFGRR